MIPVYSTRAEVDAALKPGELVCGTYVPDPEGECFVPRTKGSHEIVRSRAVYFLVPAATDPIEMSTIVYEIQHGEPHPDPLYVRWLAEEALA